jgi:phosphotransferase system IIA component
VIQTYTVKDAEGIYRTFAAQTEQLAQVDIDALRLQAGKKYAEQMVAMNEQRLQNLQQDAARQQQQAQQVMAQQQQAKQQAVSLSSDLRATSNQLDAACACRICGARCK